MIKPGSIHGAKSITAVATRLSVGAEVLLGRHTVLVVNMDAIEPIFVGFDNTVTAVNGIPVFAGQERAFEVHSSYNLDLHAITNAGKVAAVRIAEVK
jgi:hypothetical protein